MKTLRILYYFSHAPECVKNKTRYCNFFGFSLSLKVRAKSISEPVQAVGYKVPHN